MAIDKVIGGPLNSQVISQLDRRSKVFSKQDRTNEDLEYIASRTGWVKLTSGVNVGTSDALAKDYIMIGGVQGRQGTTTYSNFTNGLGFRPMPGITGVQINSINRFGLLKEAVITFNCWDVSQLSELELLFMRPGFSALLEWGHSYYVKNDGKYISRPQTVTNFFDTGITKEAVYKQIAELKESSNQNYDAILGLVKNFTWSYRPDGGYDCTTTLISIGELVESMQIALDIKAVSGEYKKDETNKQVSSTFLQAILKAYRDEKTFDEIEKQYKGFISSFENINGTKRNIPYEWLRLPAKIYDDGKFIGNGHGNKFTYISLRSFCELVNMCLLKDTPTTALVKLNTKIRPVTAEEENSTIPTSRFRTFKEHTSSDPGVCFLLTMETTSFPHNKSMLKTLRDNKEGSSDEVLNIYVNVDLLIQAVDNLVNDPVQEKKTLYNLFAPIFNELNAAMGGVNDIAFHFDDTDNTLYIVDRAVQIEEELSQINITGLKSTVTGFNFTTKLSPAVTTMIAISAQAGGADVGLEAESLLRWNEGLKDRVITTRNTSGEPSVDPTIAAEKKTREDKLQKQLQERRQTIVDGLLRFYNEGIYDKKEFATVKSEYIHYATTYIQNYKQDINKKAGPAGIIPFEVGIEMDGISGIKIGQAFEINRKIMPSRYEGVVGFLVTGIEHKIQQNRWTTNLKAQTIILESSKDKLTAPVTTNDGRSYTEQRGLAPAAKIPTTPSREFWTLAAICAAEELGSEVNYACIAQSIYNRLTSGIFGARSIAALVVAENQYAPTFSNRYDWVNIVDYNTAVTAVANVKNQYSGRPQLSETEAAAKIKLAAKAIQNSNYQETAAKSVQARTDFRGYSAYRNKAENPIKVGNTTYFYDSPEVQTWAKSRGYKPAPVPPSITSYKLTSAIA